MKILNVGRGEANWLTRFTKVTRKSTLNSGSQVKLHRKSISRRILRFSPEGENFIADSRSDNRASLAATYESIRQLRDVLSRCSSPIGLYRIHRLRLARRAGNRSCIKRSIMPRRAIRFYRLPDGVRLFCIGVFYRSPGDVDRSPACY